MTVNILMSIRPRFADAILSGAKSHELRRRFAGEAAGARVFVYSSSPVCQLVGAFSIGAVDTMPTWLLARRRRRATTLTSTEIHDYLHGVQRGTLIEVERPVRFVTPIRLSRLRDWGVEPPQSYRYLSEEVVRLIESDLALARARQPNSTEWLAGASRGTDSLPGLTELR